MGPWFPLPLSLAQAETSLGAGLIRSFLLDSGQQVPAGKYQQLVLARHSRE